MIIKKNFVIACISVWFGLASSAYGAQTHVVHDIHVKEMGESATEARQKAMVSGEKKAFTRLLRKLLREYREGMVDEFEEDTVSPLVIGVNVLSEKTTSTYYEATLDITFNMQVVKQFLQERALPYIRRKSEATIVIPIERQETGSIIWDGGPNSWFERWQELSANGLLVRIVVPQDSPKNRGLITAEELVSSDFSSGWNEKLEQLARRYRAKRIILAERSLNEGKAIVKWQDIKNTSSSLEYRSLSQGSEDLFIQNFIKKQERQWRKEQSTGSISEQKLSVDVPLRNLYHWQSIYSTLTTKIGYQVKLKELAVDQAKIELYFQTGYEELLRSLAQAGLYLRESENGWVLVE